MQVNMYGAADAARKRLAEQAAQQGDQGDADECNAAASHELLHPLTLLLRLLLPDCRNRRRKKSFCTTFST